MIFQWPSINPLRILWLHPVIWIVITSMKWSISNSILQIGQKHCKYLPEPRNETGPSRRSYIFLYQRYAVARVIHFSCFCCFWRAHSGANSNTFFLSECPYMKNLNYWKQLSVEKNHLSANEVSPTLVHFEEKEWHRNRNSDACTFSCFILRR